MLIKSNFKILNVFISTFDQDKDIFILSDSEMDLKHLVKKSVFFVHMLIKRYGFNEFRPQHRLLAVKKIRNISSR